MGWDEEVLPPGMGAPKVQSNVPPPAPATTYLALSADTAHTENHIAKQGETLRIEERILSWSGDDFSIADHAGTKRYRVNGKVFSWHSKKTLRDIDGNDLFELSAVHWTLKSAHKLVDLKTGKTVAYISKPKVFCKSLYVWFGEDNVSGKLVAKVKSKDFWRYKWDVIDVQTDKTVGMIRKRFATWKNFLTEADSYRMYTVQGVDLVLMIMLTICCDEMRGDDRNN